MPEDAVHDEIDASGRRHDQVADVVIVEVRVPTEVRLRAKDIEQ